MRHIVVALAAVVAGVLVLVRAGPIAASLTASGRARDAAAAC